MNLSRDTRRWRLRNICVQSVKIVYILFDFWKRPKSRCTCFSFSPSMQHLNICRSRYSHRRFSRYLRNPSPKMMKLQDHLPGSEGGQIGNDYSNNSLRRVRKLRLQRVRVTFGRSVYHSGFQKDVKCFID